MRDEHGLVGDRLACRAFHAVEKRMDGLLASAHLFEGNEVSLVVDMHHRLDVEQSARPGIGAADAPAAEQEHEVVDREPVGEPEAVVVQPLQNFVDAGSLRAHRGGVIDEKPFAARCRVRIDMADGALGVIGRQGIEQGGDGCIRAGKPA